MNSKDTTRSIGKLIIDLTPLLDVVLLMLIVILAKTDDSKAIYADAEHIVEQANLEKEDQIAEAYASLNASNMQLAMYEQMYDYVNVITVYASYQPSEIKFRKIHVLINGNIEGEWTYDLTPTNENDAWIACKEYIESQLDGLDYKPTVFSMASEQMLYRDEERINELFDGLDLKNLFENDLETEYE